MNRLGLTHAVFFLVGLATTCDALAVGIHDYQPVRTFSLPAPNSPSVGSVLFDALPDGRLLLLNGTSVSVESAVGSGSFNSLGAIPGFNQMFGPSFLAVSPNGARAAAGNGIGSVVVFDTANPADVSSFAIPDFYGEWIDNQSLAIANNAAGTNGIQVLNTAISVATSIVNNIGGATAGIAFDSAGNLYAGNGYSFGTGTSDTGWVKAFSATDWQTALVTASPINFETAGAPVADLLSAFPLAFDSSDNLLVGGADFYGSSGDFGYAALVDAAAVADALANPQATPPISAASLTSLLRKIASPQDTIDNFQSPDWHYNNATGELYLGFYSVGTVTVYAPVPEPSAIALLTLGAVIGAWRSRRRTATGLPLLATAVLGSLLLSATNAHAATTFDDVPLWAGNGANEAALVIDWNDGKNEESLLWGYRWDGTATGEDMLTAIAAADDRLFATFSTPFGGGLGSALFGLGYDLDDDGFTTSPPLAFADGLAIVGSANDGRTAFDSDDHYVEGWFSAGYWSYWLGGEGASPAWDYSGLGMSSRELADGSWDGWSFHHAFSGEAPSTPSAAIPEPAALGLCFIALATVASLRVSRCCGRAARG